MLVVTNLLFEARHTCKGVLLPCPSRAYPPKGVQGDGEKARKDCGKRPAAT